VARYNRAIIEEAGKIAGVSISKMMDIFKENGVEANLEHEDYLKGLKALRKVW
jgi:predicted HTH domain antitoxin